WLFYVLTGVRRGEALALRWCDLDLRRRAAAIHRSLVPIGHGLTFGEPKTNRGRRVIGLDSHLVGVLGGLRQGQAEERQFLGLTPHSDDLVFAHPDGTPLHPEFVSRRFSRRVRESGLPPMRLHDLRHLHATLALAAGVPSKVVADRLGHSTTTMTTDTYQHVLPEFDRDAAERVAGLVFGAESGSSSGGSQDPGDASAGKKRRPSRTTRVETTESEYVALIEGSGDRWSACVPDLPGCAVAAASRQEVEQEIGQAVVDYVAALRERGATVPGPTISGAVVVATP
ncbi:MAG: tyrosine-type recombinase/integrase, partial [Acidobacteriota bacterium]|nr:tyrosine-type recombinase/integrase [Acidobacteriota bacterium]